MNAVAQMPGQQRPWMEAMEAQLDALNLVQLFLREAPKPIRDLKSWNVDRRLLEASAPFAWSEEATAAVLAASQSIPLDTPLNKWNLATSCVWWYFEKALPWQTVTPVTLGIRALCFGWIPTAEKDFGLPVCCWIDDDRVKSTPQSWADQHIKTRVTPSQTFEWERNVTLGEMLERTREHHRERYGPNGIDATKPQVGEDVFMAATEGCARFLLAGLTWLNQKVLVDTPAHVERHRRKDFERKTKRPLDGVRIISLRRAIRSETEATVEQTRLYGCRWVVDGHFRNQACGPHFSDRRLTWIAPFMKGPEDKPFRETRKKVYTVDR